MKGRKKIAVGIIAVGIIIALLMPFPIPGTPAPMSILEYLRNYLLLFYDIELPRISLSPEPEIIPKEKIAFAVIPDYDYGSIYIADANGKNITLFIKDIRIRGDLSWSPDGQNIAFIGIFKMQDNGNNIYVVNMQGKITQLTKIKEKSFQTLCWSPDGKKIVFDAAPNQKTESGYTTGEPDIYIMNANGTNITKIVEKGGTPVWSPDGKKIAFTSYREDDYGNIYIINIDDGNMTKLTIRGSYPTWSADGKKIAFVAGVEESERVWVPQIFTINIDGSNLTVLTHFRSEDFKEMGIKEISYSPDGKKIAFTIRSTRIEQERAGYTRYPQVYMINADGANLIRIAEGEHPTWSP